MRIREYISPTFPSVNPGVSKAVCLQNKITNKTDLFLFVQNEASLGGLLT